MLLLLFLLPLVIFVYIYAPFSKLLTTYIFNFLLYFITEFHFIKSAFDKGFI